MVKNGVRSLESASTRIFNGEYKYEYKYELE